MGRQYRVSPAPTGWAVFESGTRIGTRDTKRAAIDYAYREARRGDTVDIRRSDGTIQEQRRVSA